MIVTFEHATLEKWLSTNKVTYIKIKSYINYWLNRVNGVSDMFLYSGIGNGKKVIKL